VTDRRFDGDVQLNCSARSSFTKPATNVGHRCCNRYL